MTFTFHHVGFATSNILAATAPFSVFSPAASSAPIIEDERLGVKVALVPLGDGSSGLIEFVEPLGPDSRVSGLLAKKITFYHICYEVPDLELAVHALRSRGGLQVVRPTPARAFNDCLVTFVMMPNHMLVELLEATTNHDRISRLGQ
jgi:methylmalonyl-CoA/ethylmalonyl-CoA epimerase